MAWSFRRRQENAPTLVASAQEVHVADFAETQSLTLSRQNWQLRAFQYHDDVGEIHFPATYVGNALAKIRLVACEEPKTTRDDPEETTNRVVKEAVAKLKAPMGGRGALLKAMGINIFLTGECFLIGLEEDGVQTWEAVSINELEIRPGERRPLRRRNPVEQPQELPEDALIVRVWRPHPRYSGLADSAMRNVLDECEKLLLLTRADKAAARSRIAGNGLLYIPNEIVPVGQVNNAVESSTDGSNNPIYKAITDSMIMPIKDEQHPSGVVPVTIFGPAEFADSIKYITFDRPQAARAIQQREESIQRIATALDLPPEILTGKADLNHWTAWQIHEETFQAHLQPFVELIVDALTVGYLRPALKRAGVKEWDKYLVWYDDSELVVRPDKGQTAVQLHEAGVINEEALRRETGFNEDDKMGEDERAKHVGIVLQDVKLALTGEPTPIPDPVEQAAAVAQAKVAASPAATKLGGDRPTIKDRTSPPPKRLTGQPSSTPKTEIIINPPPVRGSGARQRRPLGEALAQLDVQLMTQLRAQASEVLSRELDRAGARIRSKMQGDPDKRALLADVPNGQVASVLGPAAITAAGLDEQDLLAGAFAAFGLTVEQAIAAAQNQRNRLIRNYWDEHGLEGFGIEEGDPFQALYGQRDQSNRRTAVAIMLAALFTLANGKLYDPAPEAPVPGGKGETDNLLVPANLVREAVATAGGSLSSAPSGSYAPEDFGGIGTGGTTRSIFTDLGIITDGYSWVYGPAIRTPFSAHERLDGLDFESWEDESLSVRAGDEWIGNDHYHPGDHTGCLCSVAPRVLEPE